MNSPKFFIISGAISGFLAVALGAFGAHMFQSAITPQMLDIYKTGIMYQLVHTTIIVSIGLNGNPGYFKTGIFFLIGIILFSFSLYIYSLTGIIFWTFITPFGGLSFLTGWLFLIIKSIKK